MKNNYFSSLLSLVLMLALFASCSSDNYTSILPEKPLLAYKMNIANLLEKSDIMHDPMISGQIRSAINSLPGESKELAREIVNNPNSSGVDFNKSVYIVLEDIATTRGLLLAAVEDEDKLTSVIEMSGELDVEESGDINLLTVDGQTILAYDDTKLVFAFAQSGIDATEYFTNERGDYSKGYSNFISLSDDIAFYVDYEQVYSMQALIASADYSMPISPEDVAGMSVVGGINFENGKIVTKGNMFGGSKYVDKVKNYICKADGKFLSVLPENSYFVLQLALKNILQSIKELPASIREEFVASLEEVGCNGSVVDCIDGDVVLSVMTIPAGSANGIPNFALMAKCKDSSLFDYVISNIGNLDRAMTSVADNVYRLSSNMIAAGFDYCIGYVDGSFFVVPGYLCDNVKDGSFKAVAKNFAATKSASMMGSNGFAINFESLCNDLKSSMWMQMPKVEKAVSIMKDFKSVTIGSEITEGTCEICLKDETTNSLKQLINIVKKVALL